MDWIAENNKDAELINRLELSPLDVSTAESSEQLAELMQGHNAALSGIADRLKRLANDRAGLADPDRWLDCDSGEVSAEYQRITRESWDVLAALRKALRQREAILRLMEARLCEAYGRVSDAYDRAVAAAEKQLARERRALQKSHPRTADSHFADLVAEEQTVIDAAAKMNEAEAALVAVTEARRRIVVDSSAVKMRQREVFAAMVA